MPNPIVYTNCQATVIATIADPARAPLDAVVAVALERGAWEFDLALRATFGIEPAIGLALAADVREEDRVDPDGTPSGRRVSVVALRTR